MTCIDPSVAQQTHKTNHPFFGRNNNKPVISPSENNEQLKPATYPPMSALDKASTVSTSR